MALMRTWIWLVLFVPLVSNVSRAQEPGWSGKVILEGNERLAMDATPILERPYRPFHVYGNTVRRMHYRGLALPLPRDFLRAGTS